MNLLIVCLILLVVGLLMFRTKKQPYIIWNPLDTRITLWTYIPDELLKFRENTRYPTNDGSITSDFVKACNASIDNSIDHSKFNFIQVTSDTLPYYLPNFPVNMKERSRFRQKDLIDLIGAMLLESYGGLYVSPGTIFVHKNYNHLYDQLQTYDIVTFGSIYNHNTVGSSTPNTRILGAKAGLPCFKKYIRLLTGQMLGKIDPLYNHVGIEFNPLGEALHNDSCHRFHYTSLEDGTVNVHGRKLQLDDYLGKTPIEFSPRLQMISFPYENLEVETNYEWLKFITLPSLLESRINVVSYLNIGRD